MSWALLKPRGVLTDGDCVYAVISVGVTRLFSSAFLPCSLCRVVFAKPFILNFLCEVLFYCCLVDWCIHPLPHKPFSVFFPLSLSWKTELLFLRWNGWCHYVFENGASVVFFVFITPHWNFIGPKSHSHSGPFPCIYRTVNTFLRTLEVCLKEVVHFQTKD